MAHTQAQGFDRWRMPIMLSPPAIVGLVGLLALWMLFEGRGRERRARLAEEADSHVADLVATVIAAQAAEREVLMTGMAPVSPPPSRSAISADVAVIRAGLTDNGAQVIEVDSLATASTTALAACDTAVMLRQARRSPEWATADLVAARLVDRVRSEAQRVRAAAARVFDTRIRAADRQHLLGATAMVLGTMLAIAIWFLINRHLTEVAEREAAAREEAEEANRAKSLFLATMSHELRTPLNAIIGFSDLLASGVRGPLSAAQTDDVHRIKRAASHLLGLITEVLNFARIEATPMLIAHESVPVDAVLSVAAGMVTRQVEEKGLDLVRHPCNPSLFASGDRQKVVQILINLLSNAIKFTPRGGRVELRCGASQADDGRVTVWMTVRDTGRGIPANQLHRIFEPFVQVDRSHSSGAEGVGLGLAISRGLARAMGGDVSVQSEERVGAEFTLVLPYRPPKASAPVEPHADARREILNSC